MTEPVVPAPEPPGPDVTVSRADLELLMAHYWDEVLGHPDREHWTFPLLRAAVTRMAEITWRETGSGPAEPKD